MSTNSGVTADALKEIINERLQAQYVVSLPKCCQMECLLTSIYQ